jgi:hypothetical protein
MKIKKKGLLRKEIINADNIPIMRGYGCRINRETGEVTFLTDTEVRDWYNSEKECLFTYGDILNIIRTQWDVTTRSELSERITWFFRDFEKDTVAYQ